jgi:heme exporter protein D
VKWWDEEFWATTAITFASVAVTIGLTVLISWKILDRQLEHERESQQRQREDQLADLRAEVARDRRAKQAVSLSGVVDRLKTTIAGIEVNIRVNGHTVDFWSPRLDESRQALSSHEVRLARDANMYQALTELSELARVWLKSATSVGRSDNEWWEKWRAAAVLLQQDLLQLREQIPRWEDTGELSLPRSAHTRALIDSLRNDRA